MSNKKAEDLAKLERIARIKADLELKKFAAFNAHILAARSHVESLQVALTQCYDANAPLTLDEARMANVQAARSAREMMTAKAELARMLPRFELARKEAAEKFGRAEVLHDLANAAIRSKGGSSF